MDASYSVKTIPFFNSDVTVAEIAVEFDDEPHIPEPIVCPPHNFTCGVEFDISQKCNYLIQNITLCKEGNFFIIAVVLTMYYSCSF